MAIPNDFIAGYDYCHDDADYEKCPDKRDAQSCQEYVGNNSSAFGYLYVFTKPVIIFEYVPANIG